VPVPACISDLNLFEKVLIKLTMTSITVVRLVQVTNSKRPQNELTPALKGRIAHLPIDLNANAKFLPENVLNVDGLVLLVGGQPTKKKTIWTSVVDLGKVITALLWLKENNHLYKDIPTYTLQDVKKIVADRLKSADNPDSSVAADEKSLLKKTGRSNTIVSV
jgi:hypothetical protein